MKDLKDRKAIVTGSTKGIGLAVATALAKEGASVVVSARSSKDVDRVSRELNGISGARVFGKACDVSESEQVRSLIEFGRKEMGGLDILVNNAGTGVFKNVEELSVEDWQRTIGTNLNGVFYCCHFALPHLKKKGGFIINISSLAGRNPFPEGAAYNASKFGLNGFSEALMQEVRHDDIRVAYIMPGSVNTWFDGSEPEGEDSWKLAAEDVAEVVLQTLKHPGRCLTSRIEMRPSKPPR